MKFYGTKLAEVAKFGSVWIIEALPEGFCYDIMARPLTLYCDS